MLSIGEFPLATVIDNRRGKIFHFHGIARDCTAPRGDPDRLADCRCDSYKWVEYERGHPNYRSSEDDREYWSDWFGHSRMGVPKGIIVIELPGVK